MQNHQFPHVPAPPISQPLLDWEQPIEILTVTLPMTDMSEGMFNGNALSKFHPSLRGKLALMEFLQQCLIRMDRNTASLFAGGALCLERTFSALGFGKAEGFSEVQGNLELTGTGEGVLLPVENEGSFGELG